MWGENAVQCSRARKICCRSFVPLHWKIQNNCFLAQVEGPLDVTRRQVTLSSMHVLSGRGDQA